MARRKQVIHLAQIVMSASNYENGRSASVPLETLPPISHDQWRRETGMSTTTCWRLRKRGWLATVRIAGRHYVSRAEIARLTPVCAANCARAFLQRVVIPVTIDLRIDY
jgi:hypothetical protein